MAVYFLTERPQALLDEFNARLEHKEEWKRIDAWTAADDGLSYTLRSEAWARKAWMRPRVDDGRLAFNIVNPAGQTISAAVYSHYQGLLVEAFLRQLDLMFSKVVSTPRCADGDQG